MELKEAANMKSEERDAYLSEIEVFLHKGCILIC